MTALIQQIAAVLDETEKAPLEQIARVVKTLGGERAQTLLKETLRIEANGGMLTHDKKRRRTPGGVFFKLAKDKTTPEERKVIFPPPVRTGKRKKPKPAAPLPLEQVVEAAKEALRQRGEASKVKITLIGRPGKVVEKEQVVITSLQAIKAPTLPNGLPAPPPDAPPYIVFIAMKQWRKVRDSINNDPKDKLIIEGYPVFDKRLAGGAGAVTVYTTSTTTTALQRAVRAVRE